MRSRRHRHAVAAVAALLGTLQAHAQQAAEPATQSTTSPSQATAVPEASGGGTSGPSTYLQTGIRGALTYSDNLNLATRASDRQGGFVAEVSPYALWQVATDRLRSDGYVSIRNFVRSVGESDAGRWEANVNAVVRLAGETAWLEAQARAATISGGAGTGVGAIAYDPAFYSAPTVTAREFRSFALSPFVRDRTGWYDYELRYRYFTSNTPFARAVKDVHQFSGSVDSGGRFGRWNLGLFGARIRNVLGDGRTFDRDTVIGTLGYSVSSELRVGATASYERIDNFRGPNGRDYGVGPGVFFDWRPNSRFNLGAQYSRRFYGNTSSAQAGWRHRRFGMTLSWIDAVLTSADSSALFFDPSAFSAGTPGSGSPFGSPILQDPLFSRLLLQQLLLFGIAPVDITLNTSALARTRQLTWSASLDGQSNTLSGSVFRAEREVEARLAQAIVANTGTTTVSAALQGRTVQTGALASLQHRLDSRSTVGLTGRYTRFESEGNFGGIGSGTTRLAQLALSYGFRVTSDVTASMAVRRTQQSFEGAIGARYVEHAVTGIVDVRF